MIKILYTTSKLQIPVTPLIIQIPTPFLYESERVVPCMYESKDFNQGHENQPLIINEPNMTSIVRPGGISRNGRIFSQRNIVEPSAKAKEKNVANGIPAPTSNTELQERLLSPKAIESRKETNEVWRIIQKREYKVVNQLNQIPSKISMLSLLLDSKAHRDSLMKVLSVAHITKDITVDQFDDVVANITIGNFLGFNDDEMPSKGKDHKKALLISLRRVDILLSRHISDSEGI